MSGRVLEFILFPYSVHLYRSVHAVATVDFTLVDIMMLFTQVQPHKQTR